ncbi:hypothetical protein B0O99DRAFT_632827 [Bisporella sp. PMI_857]|nr:hypothetical protein B0O99DRAFT_632827 [Bisporella sp. PMI_857]
MGPHSMNGSSRPQAHKLKDSPVENFRRMKVIVIGAGFSGIYCGVRFPQRLKNIDLTIYEKNAGVGGTWWENTYPGCACDIPSHSYQYSFHPNSQWSKFYAPAPEIRAYLENVVEKYSVHRFIKCSHQVTACNWDQSSGKWTVSVTNLDSGETFADTVDVVVSARGTLNEKSWPDLEGFSDLKIPQIHSAAWDHKYNFQGKRVGVIGGGSSAIQIIPELQRVPGTKLSCFVRSRTWISRPFGDSAVGKLGLSSEEFTEDQKKRFANDPDYYLEFRSTIEREGNSVHALTLKGSVIQKAARDDFTELMKQRLAKKPEILDSLLPDFGVACRRLTPGPGYLEALVQGNVDFINKSIRKCGSNTVELTDGSEVELDVLVCATGFNASAPPPFPVVGKDGQTLAERFNPHPETYLSLATDGFPNYFMMLGPNAAIGTGSLTMMIEMEGDYIIKSVRKMQKEDIKSMEVQSRRVQDFSKVIDSYFEQTVYLDGCNSWYRSDGGRGNRITGLWPGSAMHAMETLRSPRWEDYDYEYLGDEDGIEVNRLGWLGNGWSIVQTDAGSGELAFYLQPEVTDNPSSPFPEQTRLYQLRPFSH